MSEIISVHVGGCGVNVGLSYWRQLMKDRKQQKNQSEIHYDRMYYQAQRGEPVPRAIFIDTDIKSNFRVSCSEMNFDPSNVMGYGTTCSVYAQGKYIQSELSEQFQDILQREAQKCDHLSGFILTRSPMGGSGSGVGQNVISHLSSMYKIIEEFKIMPGTDQKHYYSNINPVQVYNSGLTNNSLIEQTGLVYTLETNAVQQILERRGIKNCGLKEVNQYLGRCLTEHVNAYIEPGYLNTSQLKRATNLLPYKRVKHMAVGLSEPNTRNHVRSSLDIDNRLCRYDERNDKRIYTVLVSVRDSQFCEKQTHKTTHDWLHNTYNQSVEWLPNNYNLSFNKVSRPNSERTWSIINGAKNIDWIRRLSQEFTKALSKKSFLHHYISRGMDQMEFVEAESAFKDLISDYTVYDTYVEMDQSQAGY